MFWRISAPEVEGVCFGSQVETCAAGIVQEPGQRSQGSRGAGPAAFLHEHGLRLLFVDLLLLKHHRAIRSSTEVQQLFSLGAETHHLCLEALEEESRISLVLSKLFLTFFQSVPPVPTLHTAN